MEPILLPTKIDYQEDKENKNKGLITIEPCYPGYGITWGSAIRRVLLSSLPGAAVTAVKIKGVKHEFSTIPFVQEDVLQIILNLKQLRVKLYSEEEIRLNLKIKGEKKVYAKDIEKNAQVEIVNPNLLIATLTDKRANLEMEIFVNKGRGYVPVEERKEEREIGKIFIDAIFSPIRKVGLKVENVRVGEKTNFDKLTLMIETDGTITPLEAFIQGAELLKDQFFYLLTKSKSLESEKFGEEKREEKKDKKIKKKKEKPKKK
ncbi:MAG: DNA-directed RNA polymerase subunit alpha [Patescibacteria group bacterium]|nr:DNA-directed RNA polymerase subunit alpha [Patescibacteria group bacterium]